MCLRVKDPLEIKLAINGLLAKGAPDNEKSRALRRLSAEDVSTKPRKKEQRTSGSWFFSKPTPPPRKETAGRTDKEEWKAFKKRLLKKNKKQMVLLMAAQMHEMGERAKQLATVEAEVKQLREEVTRLTVALREKDTSKNLI